MVEDPFRGPVMVGVPSRKSRIGRGTIPKVRKWSGKAPGGPEVVGDPLEGP